MSLLSIYGVFVDLNNFLSVFYCLAFKPSLPPSENRVDYDSEASQGGEDEDDDDDEYDDVFDPNSPQREHSNHNSYRYWHSTECIFLQSVTHF